ncbi:MBL fold metallo-hydrolase, partial [uncultured Clostridium sp.]|uniref:MBL fold metallo-hydrolase n=1 Tax=uncultured Clostridium sp. TaxID=59620 RepID=UPI0025F1153A
MIVTSLVDNIGYKQYKGKHGLCFYIKTKKHNILFDVGPNNLYIKNAEKAGINISDIDIVVISHGHYDHGGGLQAFLKINKKANELSGGQKQRVSLARALINNPDIILADEPTGNLDTKTGKEVMDILNDISKSGKTVILVTHNLDDAKMADKMINIE